MGKSDTTKKILARHCSSCFQFFDYTNDDIIFDNNGYGYSTKLVKCKVCGKLNIIEYYEDRSMKLNNDSRYYDYSKHEF